MAESHPFRRGAESKDLELIRESLAEDVVLHSPILFRGFEGREVTLVVLSHVSEVFEDFQYIDELAEEGRLVLRFRANVGDKQLEGIDYLELDGDGKVTELTVFLRPLSAVNAFNERMSERLAAGAAPVARGRVARLNWALAPNRLGEEGTARASWAPPAPSRPRSRRAWCRGP